MLAINSAETRNEAASIENATWRPNTSATTPPMPAPTISIDPHTMPITACALARSSAATRFGVAALAIGSEKLAPIASTIVAATASVVLCQYAARHSDSATGTRARSVITSVRLRSNRSATMPANGDATNTGITVAA
jgi:hypothetical protein